MKKLNSGVSLKVNTPHIFMAKCITYVICSQSLITVSIQIGAVFYSLFKIKYYNNVRKVRKVRIMKEVHEDDRFIVSVKVGPKGQITIPVEARKMFDIKEGDTIMVMGDKEKGIALLKADLFYSLVGGPQK